MTDRVGEQRRITLRTLVGDVVGQPRRLWLCFFVYSVLAGCLIQLIVLPYVFPSLHDGHGLLIDGDWLRYHQVTTELARRIHADGWSVWRLRPHSEHAIFGINTAVYALTVSEPWTLIPLQAALHATSSLLLVYIVRPFVSSWGMAVGGALPFLLFPSALLTYTQISKDPYTICGGFMFLQGWLLLARWSEGGGERRTAGIAVLILGGAMVTWLMRPHYVELMQGISVLFAAVLLVRNIVASVRRTTSVKRGMLASAIAWLMVVLLMPFDALGSTELLLVGSERYSVLVPGGAPVPTLRPEAASPPRSEAAPSPRPEATKPPDESDLIRLEVGRWLEAREQLSDGVRQPVRPLTGAELSAQTRASVPWRTSWWLPAAIDDRIYSLVVLRYRWKNDEGTSTVDHDVMPDSVWQVVAYLPRLVALSFLAPFPRQWFAEGAFEYSSIMRRVAGLEMILVYVAWAGLALSFSRWRVSLEFWFVLIYSVFITLSLAFATLNVGSLHRVRYGFLMVLVALGTAGIASRVSKKRFDQGACVRP